MEQHLSQAAIILLAVVAVASVGTWGFIFWRARTPQGVLPAPERFSVTWTGWHVLFVFTIYLFFQSTGYQLSGVKLDHHAGDQAKIEQELSEHSSSDVARLFSYVSLFNLLSVVVSAGVLMLATQATQADLGLSENSRQMAKDVLIGGLGFLAATLPVLSVQFLVSTLVPYEHPVLNMVSSGEDSRLWLVAALSAAVVAPITEEFLFRVVLQGWLERLALGTRDGISLLNQETETETERPTFKLTRELVKPGAIWPVWISATVFALMHLGQGAAPIPLLLLGALLGYIYRQTHRLIPCIVLHCLFNTFSLLLLSLSTSSPT